VTGRLFTVCALACVAAPRLGGGCLAVFARRAGHDVLKGVPQHVRARHCRRLRGPVVLANLCSHHGFTAQHDHGQEDPAGITVITKSSSRRACSPSPPHHKAQLLNLHLRNTINTTDPWRYMIPIVI